MSFDFEEVEEAVKSGKISRFDADCIKERGRVLTGRFAHYCFDWDGMTVDETCPGEVVSCNCTIEGEGEVPKEVKLAAEVELVKMEEEWKKVQAEIENG